VRRKRRRKVRTSRLVLLLTVFFLLLGSGYYLARGFFAPPPSPDVQAPGQVSGDEEKAQLSEQINVLLMGVDTRGNELVARADTLMLASVNPDKKRAVVVSIPRDTRVMIPGVGWEKINATTVYGGPELAMEIVSRLLNVPVNYYAICDYQGFIDIIDTLGGVTINVERNMYHYDPEDNGIWTINLKKGKQRLNGREALMYVRYRNYDLGDITRTQHQQKFLRALVDEVMQPATVVKLPKLVPQVFKSIKTNLGLDDMVKLARAAQSFSEYDIVSQTLPGYFLEVDGISFWEVDAAAARTMMAKLYNGETIKDVVEGSKVVKTEVASNDGASSDGEVSGGTSGGSSGEGCSSSGPEAGGGSGSGEYAEDPNIVITPYVPGDDVSSGSSGNSEGRSGGDAFETSAAPDGSSTGSENTAAQPGSGEAGDESTGAQPGSEDAGAQPGGESASSQPGSGSTGTEAGSGDASTQPAGTQSGSGSGGTGANPNDGGAGDNAGGEDDGSDNITITILKISGLSFPV